MQKPNNKTRFNDAITGLDKVRLIHPDKEEPIIVDIKSAREEAERAGLDLVEVAPNAEPPVCKIMNYGKFLFEENKKKAQAKKKQSQVHIKEIKFRPMTDIGDYQIKLKNIIKFLDAGDKCKITIRFRGRELAHQELGLELAKRIKGDLEEYAQIEQEAKMEGRQMLMMAAPISKKNRKKKEEANKTTEKTEEESQADH